MDEEAYKKELEESGIEVPEEAKVEETPETPEEKPEEVAEEETTEDNNLPNPEAPKKRSIYDEYKDKKSEVKSQKEQIDKIEGEKQELQTKLEALQNADTPEEKQEALDEIDEFATEIGANPESLRKMKALFLKNLPSGMDEATKQRLERFETWETQNKASIEKQAFDTEMKTLAPQLKKDFPNASQEEMTAVQSKIDEIAHSKEFHDKDLDYVIFKNKETLSKLVSPKKRGMESKEQIDFHEGDFEFDPNIDISTLSAPQQVQWQKNYDKMMSSEGLATDGDGRKLII